MKLQRTV